MRCGEALVCQPFEAELAGLKRVPARVKGQGMSDRTTRMKAHPAYRQLVRRRSRLAWTLTAIMLVAYFGYVLLIAFDKDFLGGPSARASPRSGYRSASASFFWESC